MMVKSDRLKKLERELADLEQWLKLGLVPKKDIQKHKEEILLTQDKIREETDRLLMLKENGELEDYVAPRRPAGRAAYSDMPSDTGVDAADMAGSTEVGVELDTEASDEYESQYEDREDGDEEEVTATEDTSSEDDEEDPFSDRNRWRRGMLENPDHDEW